MILRTSPASPFGRKVKIAASVLGLSDRIEIVPADTSDPNDDLRRQNPVGKIPVLLTEDGTALYDSPVIVEFLDHVAGGGRLIPAGTGRFQVLTLQALADGLIDAAILQVYEVRYRPEERREATWVAYQAEKVTRALDHLEAKVGAIGDALDAGTIALACALGYLDFRFQGTWRASYPNLVAWLDGFTARVPAYGKTTPA
ncbi:glutathione S-transferase family protein [Salinarimonas ramus]|uniref:Glutathione S-transferase n=1 Tax=Salinarimonas ramus TaxID=690164 RepID=A0A917V2V5_9HYPH|nr:glutathione S-transferase [Salinarimonas ramus]GGK25015.1 glutathione S-transferase [Salinarimonas ramus]